MGLEEVITLISKLGFPILVAIWFMWRYEKRMDRILNMLTIIATKLEEKGDNDG